MKKIVVNVLYWIIATGTILISALLSALICDMDFWHCLRVANITAVLTFGSVALSVWLRLRGER